MMHVCSASDFRINTVPLSKLSVTTENPVKLQPAGWPLPMPSGEHLGYFSTDLFARLGFVFCYFKIAILSASAFH